MLFEVRRQHEYHLIMTKLFLFISIYLAISSFAFSQTTTGAISGALGGAGRSSADIGESYILNPAAVAHLRGAAVSFGTINQKYVSESTSSAEGLNGWHLSLNENSPDSVIGTSIFINRTESLNSQTHFNDAWFTIGNFVFPRISMGLSYHYHEVLNNQLSYLQHNLGLGFIWTPLENLGVGISFQDIKAPPTGIPPEYALGSSGGIGLLYLHKEYLRLRMDISRKINTLNNDSYDELALGLENLMTPWAVARIGLAEQKDQERKITQRLTFGLGFAGPRFGIHYAFQQFRLTKTGAEHSVDLVIPF